MSVAVDTNVIIQFVAGNQPIKQRAHAALHRESLKGGLSISPVVYAECLAYPAWNVDQLDDFLANTRIAVTWALSPQVWREAGEAFARYANRRVGARHPSPRRLLADFVIGAHALQLGSLLTDDIGFYRTNFPTLDVVPL